VKDFLKIWNLLEKKNKIYFFILVILIFILAILEVLSIAIVIPFVTLLLDPEALNNFKFFNIIKPFINFDNTQNLIIYTSVIFFVLFLTKNIFIAIVYRFLFNYVYEFRRGLTLKILKKYLYQDYLFFINTSYSKIASNISNEVGNLSTNYLRPFLIIFSDLLILLFIIILVVFSGYIKGTIIVIPFIILSAVFFPSTKH